jgi:hypothetical protein
MAENAVKVQQKVDELNSKEPVSSPTLFGLNTPNNAWVAVPGYVALTGFNFDPDNNKPVFNPGYGYPIKLFVNIKNGELKIYPASLFEN